jgi:hypothetical protein
MPERLMLTTDAEIVRWRAYYQAAATGVIVGRAQAEPAEVARMSADFADALMEEERRRHPGPSDWSDKMDTGSQSR